MIRKFIFSSSILVARVCRHCRGECKISPLTNGYMLKGKSYSANIFCNFVIIDICGSNDITQGGIYANQVSDTTLLYGLYVFITNIFQFFQEKFWYIDFFPVVMACLSININGKMVKSHPFSIFAALACYKTISKAILPITWL